MKSGAAHGAAPAWRSPSAEGTNSRQPGQRWQAGQKKVERPPWTIRLTLPSPRAAWLALPVIDVELLGEIAELAVGRGEVPQGRPAGADRLFEHCRNCLGQRIQLWRG